MLHVKECAFCAKEFTATHSGTRLCSDLCRKEINRRRRKEWGKSVSGKAWLEQRINSGKEREIKARWQAANPERVRAIQKKYRLTHSTRNRETSSKWYRANLEKARRYARKYRSDNRERCLTQDRKYRAANIEKRRLSKAEYDRKTTQLKAAKKLRLAKRLRQVRRTLIQLKGTPS